MNAFERAGLAIPKLRRLHAARNALLLERDELAARLVRCQRDLTTMALERSPFFHYNTMFDPMEVIKRHAAPDLVARPGYLTNYLGVLIDPKFLPEVLQGRQGEVEGIPIPANWHADIAEWGAALRAVDLARKSFTVVELGCGWGCWMNNTGVAARRVGLDVRIVGVEGDLGHVAFAHEACSANGFDTTQVAVHRGVAAATSGVALFPRQERAGVNWGLEPIFGATEEQRISAVQFGSYDDVPMIGLAELTAPHARVDLLHVDIQGGEADLIAGCVPILDEKVAYLVIGTHSRQIEGRILETLLGAGWILEIERPAILAIEARSLHVTVDGVQGWRNPKLHFEWQT
jgi:FkbM family methyltransferase